MTAPENPPSPPQYYYYTAPPQTPAPKPRRWMIALAVGWGLVLVVGAVFAIRGGSVTDREQTTVADARPYVDEAVARIALAATADGKAIVSVSNFERAAECDVSVLRGGERWRRGVTAVVEPGTETELLDRVAAGLPASYKTTVRTGPAPRLVADAGFFVAVAGTIVGPGEVRFYADTGDCRVPGEVVGTDVGPADRVFVQAVLDRLGLTAQEWRESSVACPEGGAIRTVEARTAAFTGALDARLSDIPEAMPVVTGPKLYAVRLPTSTNASVGVAVRARDDALLVTSATPC